MARTKDALHLMKRKVQDGCCSFVPPERVKRRRFLDLGLEKKKLTLGMYRRSQHLLARRKKSATKRECESEVQNPIQQIPQVMFKVMDAMAEEHLQEFKAFLASLMNSLKSIADEKERKISTLEAEMSKMEDQELLQQRQAEAFSRVKKLNAHLVKEVETRELRISELEEAVKNHSRELEDRELQFMEQTEEIERLEQELEKQTTEGKKLEDENTELRNKLNRSSAVVAELHKRNDALKVELKKSIQQFLER